MKKTNKPLNEVPTIDELYKDGFEFESDLFDRMNEIKLFGLSILLGILGNILASFLWDYLSGKPISYLQTSLVLFTIICIIYLGFKFLKEYNLFKKFHLIMKESNNNLAKIKFLESQIKLEELKNRKNH
ncbi:MAG: hypothetical protein PHD05_10125 [Sphaerochaetaceae bacterium]|nr:hypothetical protein [Sphaerochaetaceae bacterium]